VKTASYARGFGSEQFWNTYGRTPDYAQRIAAIDLLVPPSTLSIIDIGCGAGDVITALSANRTNLTAVGVDPAMEAIRHLAGSRAQALLPFLPFSNRQFDMVLCLEVLEHLSDRLFRSSLHEMGRLARFHAIVGVPYREDLNRLQVRCANCGLKSHAYGHLRSFGKSEMMNLLPGFVLDRFILTGLVQRSPAPVAVSLAQRLADLHHSPADHSCPHCHRYLSAASTKPRPVRWAARRFIAFVTALSPARPYWLIALYRRERPE